MVATYEYDAFGGLRSKTGAADTDFRFTGEQWDSDTGFYYLRARYYDPAIGRFVRRDPIPFIQRYAYVLNNPVNLTDPSGKIASAQPLRGEKPPARPMWDVDDKCKLFPEPTCLTVRPPDPNLVYLRQPPSLSNPLDQLADILDVLTSRSVRCYTLATALTSWTTFIILTTPEGAPLWAGPMQYGAYQALAIRTGVACSVRR